MIKISSPAFGAGDMIPKKYSCEAENISPPLEISDVPQGTKSLALIVDDPDAVSGLWTHWIMWNIPPDVKKIGENNVPPGAIEGITSFGRPGYGGPCPPSGVHRYFFKIYALDTTLDIPRESAREGLEKAIEGHIVGEGELMGRYGR